MLRLSQVEANYSDEFHAVENFQEESFIIGHNSQEVSMEKLSRILPASPRVKSVDIDEAHPVRPGAPSFGNPVGANPLRDRLTFSDEALQKSSEGTVLSGREKDARSAKLIEDMSRRFFETRVQSPIKDSSDSLAPEPKDSFIREGEFVQQNPIAQGAVAQNPLATKSNYHDQEPAVAMESGKNINIEA